MTIKRILAVAAATAAAVGLFSAPAQAQVGDACGAGYYLLHSESVVRYGDPVPAGTVYVEYSPLTNSFCGFTVKSRWIGISTQMSVVTIGAAGSSTPTNSISANSVYSVGPTHDSAWITEGQNCVLFGANITDPDGNSYAHESANPAIGLTKLCA